MVETFVTGHRRVFPVIQPGPAELFLLEVESERLDEVQRCPRVGAQPDDVTRVRWNLGLVENDGEHSGRVPPRWPTIHCT